ncbi:hypothetical protein O181_076404 [Austropuccinia psidii MF-1]|uniref:Uncharacterized protein n=1 Tax=Austropuccinia psidii MF-1 TaxID=1389203 RepID=A0A9Q3FCW4_9BASI|nr:hypothetical protein [Austropuccinia psidii MF-1]
MEEAIQSHQMDVDKEETRPNLEVSNLPQERHIWRMPELPPFPKKSINANKKIGSGQPKKRSGKYAQAFGRAHELLLTHQELSRSGEDHRTLRRLEPIVLQGQSQKDKELVEEPKYFIHRPEEGVGNDSSFGDRRPSGVYQLQKCPRTSPKSLRRSRKVPRTIKAKPIGTDLTHKGTGFPNWSLQPWTVSSIWPGLLWNSQPKSRKGSKGLFHANN